MKKKLRIIIVWILVALILQLGGYTLLNLQIQKMMGWTEADSKQAPITSQLKATIPDSNPSNLQLSYAKDYLAYSENGTLKIYNLKTETLVFEKQSPAAADQSLGVHTYQWLPDRNILLYFYTKKNPAAVKAVKVSPPKTSFSTTEPKSEDSSQAKTISSKVGTEPEYAKSSGSPQLTELYSLELPNSDEDIAPDDRANPFVPADGSEKIAAGGRIQQFVVSPTTNLMYLSVGNGSQQQLMQINVMKKVSTVSKSGEFIANMAISDRYGTLYIDSQVGNSRQIVALTNEEKQKRLIISKNSLDRILGIQNGKVYLGEVEGNKLIKIKTTTDLQDVKENPTLKTEWEGSLPFKETVHTLIGARGQVIVFDNQTVSIITDGRLEKSTFSGDENYISADGAELILLTKSKTSTLVQLQPLNSTTD